MAELDDALRLHLHLRIGGSFAVNNVAVVWPKKLKALLTEPGPLDEDEAASLKPGVVRAMA